jgi:hypothetical protein
MAQLRCAATAANVCRLYCAMKHVFREIHTSSVGSMLLSLDEGDDDWEERFSNWFPEFLKLREPLDQC